MQKKQRHTLALVGMGCCQTSKAWLALRQACTAALVGQGLPVSLGGLSRSHLLAHSCLNLGSHIENRITISKGRARVQTV